MPVTHSSLKKPGFTVSGVAGRLNVLRNQHSYKILDIGKYMFPELHGYVVCQGQLNMNACCDFKDNAFFFLAYLYVFM